MPVCHASNTIESIDSKVLPVKKVTVFTADRPALDTFIAKKITNILDVDKN